MRIEFAEARDLDYLAGEDDQLPPGVLQEKVGRREILVLRHDGRRGGALRWGHLWDHIPFMNMPWIEKGLGGRGYGTRLIAFWEDEMRRLGHDTVMTSTLSSERAQHLYRRLGYEDCGSLVMSGEALEILFSKKLD